MAGLVSAEECREIAASLIPGATCRGVASKHGRSTDTVRRIAREEGFDFSRAATEKATQAHQRYDEAERREVLNEMMDKGRQLLADVYECADYQKLTVGIATTIDKIRLETGEATSREERWNGDARGKQFAELFSQLDAYRTGVDDGNGAGDTSKSIHPEHADTQAATVSRPA